MAKRTKAEDKRVGIRNLVNRRALPLIGAARPRLLEPPDNGAAPPRYLATHTRALPRVSAPAALHAAIDRAVARGRGFLAGAQHRDGYWVGELEADVSLNAEYLMFLRFIDRWDPGEATALAAWIRHRQLPDGSFAIFHGGPGDLSATIEAYFGLKLAGASPAEPAMARARAFIRAQGGVMRARALTKIFLAFFGQFPWRGLPEIPVEWMFLPRIVAFNIYEFACWARAYTVPLMVLNAKRPLCALGPAEGIDELYVEPPDARDFSITVDSPFFSWKNLFKQVDTVLKILERNPLKLGRGWALRKAERWILDHQDEPGDWGGIFPAMMNSVMALLALGHSLDEEPLRRGCEALARLCLRERIDGMDTRRVQPCVSPVWDTAWAVLALVSSGSPDDDPAVARGCRWLQSRQIRRAGDWAVKAPGVEPGGWCFQFANDFYPDIDDSSVVLMALTHRAERDDEAEETVARGFRWALALQNDDGGWGAFERHVDNPIYNRLLFNDKQNMLDPSTADVTARVIEMMGVMGMRLGEGDGPLERAVEFLRRDQQPDGSWWGRWGINHVYGTWSVLVALRAIELPADDPMVRRAVAWLESVQHPDGGFGETAVSYEDPEQRGRGPSTPSQTAWGLMALLASATDGVAAQKAARYLIERQADNGDWIEPDWTGTGFPGAFYLRYHMYRAYFPVMALGRYRAALERT